LKEGKLNIRCPGAKPDKSACNADWPLDLCKRVAVLTLDELEVIDSGFNKLFSD
jgi:hypothetical protein